MAAPTVASNGARAASFSGITLPAPFASAAAADDLQLWINETLTSEAVTFGTANDCAILATGVSDNANGTRLTPIWRRFASQSDGTLNDPGDHIQSRGLTIQGQHLTDPFHQVTTGTLAADTSHTIVTGMTTTADECLIILMVTSFGPDASSANSSEFTASNGSLTSVAEVFESLANQGSGNGILVVQGTLATAGAVGSFSITSANSTEKAWCCIAIQPPASGVTIAADTDAIALGGQDAGLLFARLLQAESGAVALGGQDASLEQSLVLTADAGSLSLSGQDATLEEAGDILIDAEVGAVSVSGTAAGLLRSLVLSAEVGTVSVTGQIAFFQLDRVGETGAVSVSGQDVGLTISRTIDAESGPVSVAGTAAGLLVDYVLDAEVGSIALNGQDATLSFGTIITIVAESDAIAVGGQTADLLRHRVLAAEAGAVGVAGVAVTNPRDYLLAGVAGALTLGGQDATLTVGSELFPAGQDIFGSTGRVNIMGRT